MIDLTINDTRHGRWTSRVPTRPEARSVDIAIIGGGVSGALVAYHLLVANPRLRVAIIDPREQLGLGLAYSTPSLRHLLNVPAGKISCLEHDPDHFVRWLKANHDPHATADSFAPRAIFARYVQALTRPLTGPHHLRAQVIDCEVAGDGAVLTLDGGERLSAKRVVLATGNFEPAALRGVAASAVDARVYHHDAWKPQTYQNLKPHERVILIGTGLTAVDVLLRLREIGHRGAITAVSRHGLLPHRHELSATNSEAVIPAGTEPTCLAYLRSLRGAIKAGMPWRCAVDSLRATCNDLWRALPLHEQRRFRRHLQRRWDVARHRMAPQIADAVERELQAGSLQIRKGRVARVDLAADRSATVAIAGSHGAECFAAERVINCTGPNMNYRTVKSALLESLFSRGSISTGPLGLGLHTDARGAIIDASGSISDVLFSVGPARMGTLFESIAVPELRGQAVEVARTLREACAKHA